MLKKIFIIAAAFILLNHPLKAQQNIAKPMIGIGPSFWVPYGRLADGMFSIAGKISFYYPVSQKINIGLFTGYGKFIGTDKVLHLDANGKYDPKLNRHFRNLPLLAGMRYYISHHLFVGGFAGCAWFGTVSTPLTASFSYAPQIGISVPRSRRVDAMLGYNNIIDNEIAYHYWSLSLEYNFKIR